VEQNAPSQLTQQINATSAKSAPAPLTEKDAAAANPTLRPQPAENARTMGSVDRATHAITAPPISESTLQSYVGVYAAPNVEIAITADDDTLAIAISGEPMAILVPAGGAEFRFAGSRNDWVKFLKDQTGAVLEVEVSQGGRRFRARRSMKKTTKASQ
jgi:hypothetical protein